MKKTMILLVTLMMGVMLFTACSNDNSTDTPSGGNASVGGDATSQSEEVAGVTFDTGTVSVLAPDGWKAFNAVLNGADDPDSIIIGKGFESVTDSFSKPYLQITYNKGDGASAESLLENAKSMYDDAQDAQAIETTNFTWNGFTYVTADLPALYFIAGAEEDALVLGGFLENDGATISLDDADVKAIIDSVKITAK